MAEEGYTRLFLNFGKRDNFFAREIINLVNRYVKGKVEIGRIDLLNNCSFFEVPEEQAELVMGKMAKAKVGERRGGGFRRVAPTGKPTAAHTARTGRTRRNEDRYADIAQKEQAQGHGKTRNDASKTTKNSASAKTIGSNFSIERSRASQMPTGLRTTRL